MGERYLDHHEAAASFSGQRAGQFEALARGAVAAGIEPADRAVALVGNALGARVDQAVPGMDVNYFADNQVALRADLHLLEQPTRTRGQDLPFACSAS